MKVSKNSLVLIWQSVPMMAFVLILWSCTTTPSNSQQSLTDESQQLSALQLQAKVMDMADEYIASLSQAIYIVASDTQYDTQARALAMSFLRNGVGATLGNASGPNPHVSLLDLLVLASLNTWSFETHWVPAGIDETIGAKTTVKLREAEQEMWLTALDILSEEQETTLRGIIQEWIQANPDRMVVSLIRFDDFTDERLAPTTQAQRQASGLLRDLRNAVVSVEEARLLGERALWFAGRLPYVIGEQAELTTYRILNQPEFRKLMKAVDGVNHIQEYFTTQFDHIQSHLLDQQEEIFEAIRHERQITLQQLEGSLIKVAERAIEETFNQLVVERDKLFSELDVRQSQLSVILTEVRDTVHISKELAAELTQTSHAANQLIAPFQDHPPDLQEIQSTIRETTLLLELLTNLLDQTHQTLQSENLDMRVEQMSVLTADVIDYAFWRGLVLIVVLLVGMAFIRMIPAGPRSTSNDSHTN